MDRKIFKGNERGKKCSSLVCRSSRLL